MKRVGVSQILASLILIGIVLGIGSVYYVYSTQNISRGYTGLASEITGKTKKIRQESSVVYNYKGSGSWYNTTYYKKRPIIVDNSGNPNTLHDYPVVLTVNYDSDMKPDFSDVAFVWYNQSSGGYQPMNYQLLEKVDGSYAKYKVYLPVVDAYTYYSAENTTFWMYYGVSG